MIICSWNFTHSFQDKVVHLCVLIGYIASYWHNELRKGKPETWPEFAVSLSYSTSRNQPPLSTQHCAGREGAGVWESGVFCETKVAGRERGSGPLLSSSPGDTTFLCPPVFLSMVYLHNGVCGCYRRCHLWPHYHVVLGLRDSGLPAGSPLLPCPTAHTADSFSSLWSVTAPSFTRRFHRPGSIFAACCPQRLIRGMVRLCHAFLLIDFVLHRSYISFPQNRV